MKRRLNFGVALLHEPKLLILDEPTVGVDAQSRVHLLDQVRQLSGRGVGVIYASHYMDEVQTICDRVAVMDHGRIIAMDTLDALLQRVSGKVELVVSPWRLELSDHVAGLADVTENANGEARLVLPAECASELAKVLSVLDGAGVEVQSIETRASNLESLFLQLTGHTLRD
jgi:ABC-2 type transport system ATP-binding protein